MPVHRRTIIASLLLSAAVPRLSFAQQRPPAARMKEADALAALKTELETRAKTERFWGAVLVAKAGKAVFHEAYGFADRDKTVLNTPSTKFRYGSMAKMFTGVGAGQLAQAGKLSFEAPISAYLPDYPNKETAAATIHQLLTHTAGTGDFVGPAMMQNRGALKELKDYVALFGDRAPRFQPGSRYEYSNYGMVIMGRIIEAVSGRNYFDYVRDHIFTPAGMTATSARFIEGETVQDLAHPFTRLRPGQAMRLPGPNDAPPSEPLRAREVLMDGGTSAGGGYSSVDDFVKFAEALTSNKLLDAKHTAIVTTGKVEIGMPGLKYAYGFSDGLTPDGVRRYGHNGGTLGVNGILQIYPESRYVIAVLANVDPPAADAVMRFVEPQLPLA